MERAWRGWEGGRSDAQIEARQAALARDGVGPLSPGDIADEAQLRRGGGDQGALGSCSRGDPLGAGAQ